MDASQSTGGREELQPETEWALVEAACGVSWAESALERLLEHYLPELESYLVRRFGVASHQADDWVQGFILEKVLQKNLLRKACPGRGTFRGFLLSALHNYVIQQMRWNSAAQRGPLNHLVPLDELSEAQIVEPGRAFEGVDVVWARTMLTETLRRMKEDCAGSDRLDLWGVFEARLLAPLVQASSPASYAFLVRQFGFKSAVHAANALVTAKRMFEQQLRTVITAYAPMQGAVEAEIEEVKEILLHAGVGIAFESPQGFGCAQDEPQQMLKSQKRAVLRVSSG